MTIQNPNLQPNSILNLQMECETLYRNLSDDQRLALQPIEHVVLDRLSGAFVSQPELDLIKNLLQSADFSEDIQNQFIVDIQQATPDSYESTEFNEVQTISSIQKHVRDRAIAHLQGIKDSPSKGLLHSETQLESKIAELTTQSDVIHNLFLDLNKHPQLQSLDDSHLEYLEQLTPSASDFQDRLIDFLQTYNLPDSQEVLDFMTDKLSQAEMESRTFSKMVDDLQVLFENDLSEINKHKVKTNNIDTVERTTGLKIREGNQYFYLDQDFTQHNFSIAAIETIDSQASRDTFIAQTTELISTITALNGHTVDSLLSMEQFQNHLDQLIQQDPSSTDAIRSIEQNLLEIQRLNLSIESNLDMDYIYDNFQTIIHLEGDLPYGSSDTMTIQEFQDFLESKDIRELIVSQQDLEQNIEYHLYGQTITIGTQFEVCRGFQDANNPNDKSIRETYKVTKIENNILTIADKDGAETQMSFPEFARWYRLNRVEEKVSLQRAREILENQPAALRAKYAHLSTEEYFSDNPIQIVPGEVLHARDGSYFTIQEVEDNGDDSFVVLDTGRKMSIPEFVEFCKDYELQNFNLQDPEELPSGQPAESAKKKSKKQGMNPLHYLSSVKNIFFDPLELLELQLLNFNDYAQLASMAKNIYGKHIERKDKERLNKVGKNLPGELGRRFSDEESSIIGEKIKDESERISSDTVFDVIEKLNKAKDRYKARAYIDFLADKGMLNLEDPRFQKTLNNLLQKHKDVVLGNTNAPHTEFMIKHGISKSGKTAKTASKAALDALYGKGTGDEIANKQDRSYSSEVDNYKKVISEEFFKIGGLGPEIHKILDDFVNGKDVHPAQFEGYLTAGIENAFLDANDAMFFIIAGMAAKSPAGTTLLTDSYINRMKRGDVPQIDYLARLKDEESGSKLQGLCPEILEFLEHRPGKTPPYNKNKLAQYIRLEASSAPKTKARVDSTQKFDKEYTQHAFPAASPESMYTKLGVNRQLSEINFGQEQIDNSFEGFVETLNMISQFEAGKSDIGAISSVKYTKMKDADRARNMAEVLGSWYVLFSNIDSNVATAYDHPSPIKDYAYNKRKHLDLIKPFIAYIIKSYPDQIDQSYTKYLLGQSPIPQGDLETKRYVGQFFKKFRDLAATNPQKFLGLIKGARFTKDGYVPAY